MRNVEANSEQVSSRADDPHQRDCDDAAAAYGTPGYDPYDPNKSDRIHLDELLPFLEERIAFKMPSEFRHLDGVLDYLNERMLRLGIVNPGDSEVIIALDEAIVNAIKHGNRCDPRKAVHIVAEFTAQGVRFTVADEGAGFALEKVPDPTEPCRLLEPSGRGLLLIHHIMDEVCFNQSGNQLEMFKRTADRSHHHVSSADRNDTE
ncbi:MAG: ATP-binding protein [Blastocatellia bacterium]